MDMKRENSERNSDPELIPQRDGWGALLSGAGGVLAKDSGTDNGVELVPSIMPVIAKRL